MTKILFALVAGLTLTPFAYAETALFPASFILTHWSSGAQKGIATCDMIQNLKWGDQRLFAKCKFNGRPDVISFAGEALRIGYDYNAKQAIAVLDVSVDQSFGQFLLKNMGAADLSGTNRITLYFGREKPYTKDTATYTDKVGDVYKMEFDGGGY